MLYSEFTEARFSPRRIENKMDHVDYSRETALRREYAQECCGRVCGTQHLVPLLL